MDSIYIAIIVLAVLGILSLVLYFALKEKKPKRTIESLYSDGLRLMLDGELAAAADKFKQVVRKDTSHVDAYIKLGDIFRENQQHAQALKIHQTLTVRRDLNTGQRIDIYYSLVQDYKALGKYVQALETADKLLDLDKRHIKGLRAKMEIYRLMDRWEEAGEVLKSLQKIKGEQDPSLVALYKIQEGRKLEKAGDGHEARVKYRKALKIDERCCAAYYYLGQSYDNESRPEDAVENWKKFGETCPGLLFLVSDVIEQRLFDLGHFNEVEEYYTHLFKKYPDNIEAAASLASIYEKKGDLDDAINSVEDALLKDPTSFRARILLAKFYNQKNGANRNVDEQLNALLEHVSTIPSFTCKNCGHTTSEVHWICPNCYESYAFFDNV